MESIPQHLVALFAAARIGYTNGRDHADAQAALVEYGYTPERLTALLAEVDVAEEEAEEKTDAYKASGLVTLAMRTRYRALRKLYVKHVKLMRAEIEEGSKGWRVLGLKGKRARATDRLLTQADSFYRALALDPDLLAVSSDLTIDQAMVDAQRAEVEEIRKALAAQTAKQGTAEGETEERNEAADEVSKAWGKFRRIARTALEDQPKLLEVLGLKDPS